MRATEIKLCRIATVSSTNILPSIAQYKLLLETERYKYLCWSWRIIGSKEKCLRVMLQTWSNSDLLLREEKNENS